MNMAVFFQKYDTKFPVSWIKKFYMKLFVRSNRAKVQYLRDAGAKIGAGCVVHSVECFGSEPYLVEVGNNTYFSGIGIKIFTHDGGAARLYHMGIAPDRRDCFGKVKIGSNCFIGHGVTILKNVTIGDNCIIGAGAVVSKSIPAGSVAAGVPARVIGTVEDYYRKNKDQFDDTVGWNAYRKRRYVEENMDRYEALRRSREG